MMWWTCSLYFVFCLYLCLCCIVSVSLPNFRWIKIYVVHATYDHTVLPATRQRWHSRLARYCRVQNVPPSPKKFRLTSKHCWNAASLLWSRNVVKMKVFVAARCPSVCLSQHGPTAATRVSPAGRRYRSAAARRAAANAGSATLSAAVGGWTQTCLCESSETVNSFVLLEQCRNKSQIYAKREQVLTATLSASCTRPPAEMVIFIHRKIRLQQ